MNRSSHRSPPTTPIRFRAKIPGRRPSRSDRLSPPRSSRYRDDVLVEAITSSRRGEHRIEVVIEGRPGIEIVETSRREPDLVHARSSACPPEYTRPWRSSSFDSRCLNRIDPRGRPREPARIHTPPRQLRAQ